MHKHLFIFAAALLLTGCATPKFSGIDEYQQLTTKAEGAMKTSLRATDQLNANPAHCTPSTIADFEHAVQRLQVDSIQIRARARAIQARGTDYFASWEESMANTKDSRVREAAQRSHTELEASFSRINAASQTAGAAFDLFLAGLLKLRADLETKAGQIDNDTDRQLLRDASKNGHDVLHELGAIDSELLTMKKLLTSH